jgi:hypothetical protein
MFEKTQKLDVTPDELAVIEAALHTQAKILNVQASAGGNAARRRLNEVKRALAHISQQTGTETRPARRGFFGWFGFARASS